MTIPRPSGATLVTVALLILLPTLAVLQYQWVGQLSTAARERLQRNVRIAAAQFREGFDVEILRAVLSLQVGPATVRESVWERYAERYTTWLNTAAHPQVVSNVLVVDAEEGMLRLRRWNPDTDALEATEWRPVLSAWREQFEQELKEFQEGRPFDRRPSMRGEGSLVIVPLRNLFIPTRRAPGSQTVTSVSVFGFTIIELNMPYIREQMLPELAARHFTHVEGDIYRVAVTTDGDPTSVLYRSDPDAPVDPRQADVSAALFVNRPQGFGLGRPPRPGDGDGSLGPGPGPRLRSTDGPARRENEAVAQEPGRWRLLVQHQSGSLEAAVAHLRRRNLGVSFGILLLLTVSIALLAATSRRAHRLAEQQMEFVAGVSHELRTPVAVIRSAAENLSHGVVDGGDRVKRYGNLLETEAKRLGEMVERVLQYAGIEAGLTAGARVSLAPSEIIEGAIESSLPMLEPERINVEREFAPNLPTVLGDGIALRSAVQNLIANAAKYGGRDRWIGIKTEQAQHRRRSEVRITVSDHGPGIPADELPHIFDPFYRGADAVARQIHGNGLGLSLVRQIVAAHGGRVTVTTRAGAGSSFTIALPAEPGQHPSAVTRELQPTHS
ncbi:MAG TPA: HAMP domain-containing sensor histidine kinase [Vicinamibacterales bacterium]|nr:HAMP domain-containing sensor histidine kinase [Vicinamibacterales bacterium]